MEEDQLIDGVSRLEDVEEQATSDVPVDEDGSNIDIVQFEGTDISTHLNAVNKELDRDVDDLPDDMIAWFFGASADTLELMAHRERTRAITDESDEVADELEDEVMTQNENRWLGVILALGGIMTTSGLAAALKLYDTKGLVNEQMIGTAMYGDTLSTILGTSEARITSKFGEVRTTGIHRAVDVALAVGSPLYAPFSGVVKHVGNNKSAEGLYITMVSDDGRTYTSFSHLNRSLVKKGDRISVGQHVADSGNTGRSTGPHLHLVMKQKDSRGNWQYIDPEEGISHPTPARQLPLYATTRAGRNNNPLNIRLGNDWQGEIKGTDTAFETFDSEGSGVRAGAKLLYNYQASSDYGNTGGKSISISQIVNKFAPASDNNDTAGYIENVSRRTGYGAEEQIDLTDPNTLYSVMSAMAVQESGYNLDRNMFDVQTKNIFKKGNTGSIHNKV